MKENLRTELEAMAATWPILMSAALLSDLLGGHLTPKTLANYRWSGTKGPKAHRLGRKVIYLKSEVLNWLEAEMGPFDPENIAA